MKKIDQIWINGLYGQQQAVKSIYDKMKMNKTNIYFNSTTNTRREGQKKVVEV